MRSGTHSAADYAARLAVARRRQKVVRPISTPMFVSLKFSHATSQGMRRRLRRAESNWPVPHRIPRQHNRLRKNKKTTVQEGIDQMPGGIVFHDIEIAPAPAGICHVKVAAVKGQVVRQVHARSERCIDQIAGGPEFGDAAAAVGAAAVRHIKVAATAKRQALGVAQTRSKGRVKSDFRSNRIPTPYC